MFFVTVKVATATLTKRPSPTGGGAGGEGPFMAMNGQQGQLQMACLDRLLHSGDGYDKARYGHRLSLPLWRRTPDQVPFFTERTLLPLSPTGVSP